MPIGLDALRRAALRPVQTRSLTEARAQGLQTAFLCHSHIDRNLARGLVALLSESGWRAYVDWEDPTMPPSPNRETAARIKKKIVEYSWFLFLATPNSMASRWCPWEIGYADGMKPIDSIIIVPTSDDNGRTHGSEYLDLYRKLDVSREGPLAVWQPGNREGMFVESLR